VCVVGYRSLRRVDHSSREVQPSVVCLSVIVKPRKEGGPIPLGAVVVREKNIMAQTKYRIDYGKSHSKGVKAVIHT